MTAIDQRKLEAIECKNCDIWFPADKTHQCSYAHRSVGFLSDGSGIVVFSSPSRPHVLLVGESSFGYNKSYAIPLYDLFSRFVTSENAKKAEEKADAALTLLQAQINAAEQSGLLTRVLKALRGKKVRR